MTKWEVVHKIAIKNNMYSPTIVGIVLNELEIMGLIKFETEREAAIKEAEKHVENQSNDCSRIIKRLLALVK